MHFTLYKLLRVLKMNHITTLNKAAFSLAREAFKTEKRMSKMHRKIAYVNGPLLAGLHERSILPSKETLKC
jgi:hypothetical protein